VTHDHALREAGGPGRVHDLGHIAPEPMDRRERFAARADFARIEDARRRREPARLPREHVPRRDQTTGTRVREHVLDLARAERLVRHDGDRTRGQRAEVRRGSVPTTLQQDRDAVVGPDAGGPERGTDRCRALPQGGVGDRAAALYDGGPVAVAPGAIPQEERGIAGGGGRHARRSDIDRQRALPVNGFVAVLQRAYQGTPPGNSGTTRVARARQGCATRHLEAVRRCWQFV